MSGGETKGGVQGIQPKGTSVSPKQGPDVTVCGLKVNSFSHRPWIQATAGLHNFKKLHSLHDSPSYFLLNSTPCQHLFLPLSLATPPVI